jgi:hypothetical protein
MSEDQSYWQDMMRRVVSGIYSEAYANANNLTNYDRFDWLDMMFTASAILSQLGLNDDEINNLEREAELYYSKGEHING